MDVQMTKGSGHGRPCYRPETCSDSLFCGRTATTWSQIHAAASGTPSGISRPAIRASGLPGLAGRLQDLATRRFALADCLVLRKHIHRLRRTKLVARCALVRDRRRSALSSQYARTSAPNRARGPLLSSSTRARTTRRGQPISFRGGERVRICSRTFAATHATAIAPFVAVETLPRTVAAVAHFAGVRPPTVIGTVVSSPVRHPSRGSETRGSKCGTSSTHVPLFLDRTRG